MSTETQRVKIPAVISGYKRQWVECRECKAVAYYDFIPYSLSSHLATMPCHHGAAMRLENATNRISEEDALARLEASHG
ncbi:hypothetical protein [Luteibacter yeojuensis]|uniref:Uncharacterized protein n=1 Tax=Luteibacter yeojuensis TaxID=345309 RepID=A0A7X5TNU9_9GAMM|nr:hypothetical protein [Luteibacter yeojuensis]NID14345.1 hypothetical protein [Luteibacter yeojuensis]